ncbi:LamB/YcsF [Hypoxylon crocopeplum]|nr:LamB/YcsF [Hypoxylon crocopeplum]
MAQPRWIEINCDMGEGFGRWKMGPDEDLMQYVDVANIACGFHAGDPSTMARTARLAKQHGVRVGAHPGLPDLVGFGRRRMDIAAADVHAAVLYQVGALAGILAAEGVPLNHVKPHGELYFSVQRDAATRDAVLRAVRAFDVPVYGLPTAAMRDDCRRLGVTLVPELYVDIDYDDTGALVPVAESARATPDSITDRVETFRRTGQVKSRTGAMVDTLVARQGSSICIHSDLPGALENAAAAKAVVNKLQESGGVGGNHLGYIDPSARTRMNRGFGAENSPVTRSAAHQRR